MKKLFALLLTLILISSTVYMQDLPKKKPVHPLNELKKYYFEGKYKEALLAYLGIDEKELTAEEEYYLGMTSLSLYNSDVALNHLETAVEKSSDNTGYKYQLAKAYLFAGKTISAEKLFASILASDPEYLPALFDAGVLDFSQKRYDEAVRKFKRVIKIAPGNFLAFYNAGKAYYNLEPPAAYSDSVSTCLAACIGINPDYLPAVEMLATQYMNKKNYDEALRLFLSAAKKNPAKGDYPYLAGMCYEKEGEYRKAISLFNKAIEINPDEAHYWDHLGFSYYALNGLDSSITAYKKAIKLEEISASYNVNLAYAYAKADSIPQAIESFQTAITKLDPATIGGIYCQIGNLYYGKKDYKEAKKIYLKVQEYDPLNIEAYYLGAISDDEMKNTQLALAGYKRALQLIKDITSEADLKTDERYNTIKGRIESLSRKGKKVK